MTPILTPTYKTNNSGHVVWKVIGFPAPDTLRIRCVENSWNVNSAPRVGDESTISTKDWNKMHNAPPNYEEPHRNDGVFRKSENGVIWKYVESFKKMSTSNQQITFVIARNVENNSDAGMTWDQWAEMPFCDAPAKKKVVTIPRKDLDLLLSWANSGVSDTYTGKPAHELYERFGKIKEDALQTERDEDDDA
jgi:hypothetical protein